MTQFRKFGKRISYDVNPKNGHWMIVESDGDIYMYITKNGLEVPNFRATPEYVNKKNFWDLGGSFWTTTKRFKQYF